MNFISMKGLKDSKYTEPYVPYVYCGYCYGCCKNGELVRHVAEGKEERFRLYVRLACPKNPDHNGDWHFHTMRPLRFRLVKTVKKLLRVGDKKRNGTA